jgi:hypothetical protein
VRRFKVGDIVKITKNFETIPAGTTGVITEIEALNFEDVVRIKFFNGVSVFLWDGNSTLEKVRHQDHD